MDRKFEAKTYAGVGSTPDGTTFHVVFEGADGRPLLVTLPTPMMRLLMRQIHGAMQTAMDREEGAKPLPPNGPQSLTVVVPRSFQVTRDALTNDPIFVFDGGTPSQMAFSVTRKAVLAMAQALMPYLREEIPGPTKQ